MPKKTKKKEWHNWDNDTVKEWMDDWDEVFEEVEKQNKKEKKNV